MRRLILLLCIISSFQIAAQDKKPSNSMEIYGHIMLDMGYDFGRVNPDWFDVLRPSKLLDDSGNPFTPKGNFFMGVRQTRMGVRNTFQTGLGELKTWFEFEMMGTGADAGRTTFRLRHAYAELGRFGFGQTNSLFMDGDVFPNSIEYWGPNAMPLFRNIQLRYTALHTEKSVLRFALENPGASSDQGEYGTGFEYANLLSGVKFRFPMPDVSAEYRYSGKWGHVELAGIVRNIRWVDDNSGTNPYDFSGGAVGWGLNLSTNFRISNKVTFRGLVTKGAGVQNYLNDADVDIGIDRQYDNPVKPIKGKPIPMTGIVAFFDIQWDKKWSTAIGYSRQHNQTRESQLSTAYKVGDYALVNLLCTPAKNCLVGLELQYGSRTNTDFVGDPVFNIPAAEGNSVSVVKVQASFKYNFSHVLGGK